MTLSQRELPRLRATSRLGSGEAESPFARGDNERPLRIVIDWPTVERSVYSQTLAGFLHHPLLDVAEIQGDGELPSLVFDDALTDSGALGVTVTGATNVRRFWIGGAPQYADIAASLRHQGSPHAVEDIERELLVVQAAREWPADLLVTSSHFLLDETTPQGLVGYASPVVPEQALALIGLYLRSREDFTFAKRPRSSHRVTRGLFDTMLARALLVAWPDLAARCYAAGRREGCEALTFLGHAVLLRYSQALRARDRVLIHGRTGRSDGPDEQLFYLDHALLALSGAFDALARVVHLAYGVESSLTAARWNHTDGWVRRLRGRAPKLADAVRADTQVADALTLIASLRNTIHGEALRMLHLREQHGVLGEHYVEIPADEAPAFLRAVDRRGGAQRWGLREVSGFGFVLRPDRYVDTLLSEAAEALNGLMRVIDLHKIAVADEPLPSEGEWLYGDDALQLVRTLAGL